MGRSATRCRRSMPQSAQLPLNMPYPPTIRKVNPADTPILVLGLTSDTPAPDHRRCLRGKYPAAKDLADFRRWPGRYRRPAEAGDPRATRSSGAGGARHQSRRCAQRARPGQCRPAKGHAQQPTPNLYAQYQRPAAEAPTTTPISSSPIATARRSAYATSAVPSVRQRTI